MANGLRDSALLVIATAAATATLAAPPLRAGEPVSTGQRITPLAARGTDYRLLNPGLESNPAFVAGQPVATAVSPDGATLLVMTSGFNRMYDLDGYFIEDQSNEYVFVYDVAGGAAEQKQVLQVPNTFIGLAWAPDGTRFYASGGVDDVIHVYARDAGGSFLEDAPIALGHGLGNGIDAYPMLAGIAVNGDGTRLAAANYQHDSVSLVDLATGAVLAEADLRPGKIDPAHSGVPGGQYPWAVAFAGGKLYATSQRDREIVVLDATGDALRVTGRIAIDGQPNALLAVAGGKVLFAAVDNSDRVVAIDTATDRIAASWPSFLPRLLPEGAPQPRGANPNALAVSPDGTTLYVSNGGMNSVAVYRLGRDIPGAEKNRPQTTVQVGQIPTGWYPNAVAVSRDGRHLFIANGKSNAGANPLGCRDTTDPSDQLYNLCYSRNEYIWQLMKGGLAIVPVPQPAELEPLTRQVAANNNIAGAASVRIAGTPPGAPVVPASDPFALRGKDAEVMRFLRDRIDHVVFIVKENRTYDQVLGALEVGNGDPSLCIFPEPLAPNHYALARQFVTLDNFHVSGQASNDGWNWTTAARTTDFTEKTAPVNYAGRGLQYDWQGYNRGINVGQPTLAERRQYNPNVPEDPDVLPGTADVAAPDSADGEAGAGYLWDEALRRGLTIRNYGFYSDDSLYYFDGGIPAIREPFKEGTVVSVNTKASLAPHTDPYFATYDMRLPDYWRLNEWEREFDQMVAAGSMPALTLLYYPHDHFGSFGDAIDGVNDIETQMADNDYAVGRTVERIATSPFGPRTLVFIIEDDAQDGPDHVDAHRSIAYVVGPYVRRQAVVSERYTTVSMIRTIVEVLGLSPLGLYDALSRPMTEVFDTNASPAFAYSAVVPDALRRTELPLAPEREGVRSPQLAAWNGCYGAPRRDTAYWSAAMAGQEFRTEDRLDTVRFNQALWDGLKTGAGDIPARHGRDMRANRAALIRQYRESFPCPGAPEAAAAPAAPEADKGMVPAAAD